MANIMIVDDDLDLTAATKLTLESHGHNVRVALDTDTAKTVMLEDVPDLVILDVMFPEDSAAGFSLARDMHADDKLTSVPILMLTAINAEIPLGFTSDDIDETWMPVKSFLEKPVDFGTLLTKVNEMLGDKASDA
ncbi:MAG: response regulator [Phycisphaerae bacterium]|jgi:DNA-binding response OmpR family regulator|nr:response regulator [Phycisphaerae bacterium]